MNHNLDLVIAKIQSLEKGVSELRSNYSDLNKTYIFALTNLNELTRYTSETSRRATYFAEQSKLAAMNAALAAKEASKSQTLILLAIAAFTAASAAAVAAAQSAAAAASAEATAAMALAHQAEDSLLNASAKAASATKVATDSAAEAAMLSNQASQTFDFFNMKR